MWAMSVATQLRPCVPEFKLIATMAKLHGTARMWNRSSVTRSIVAVLLTTGAVPSLGIAKSSAFSDRTRPQPASASNEEQSAVGTRLANTFADTWNRRDGRAYGNAYWPDAELVDPSGQVWSGRGAIIQTHIDLWNGPAKATLMTAHVRRVRALSPSLLVVDIDTSATGFAPPPKGAPNGIVQTRLKHVVQKRNGEWKIVSSQNTFISQR